MQVVSTIFQFISRFLIVSAALLTVSSAVAQSAADNIRPVGQVCLAGQACVGAPAGGAVTAPAEPVAAVQEPTESVEPTPAAPVAEASDTETASLDTSFDVEAKYQMSCFACHASGAAGAPLLGDAEAWNSRLEKGMDAVMANVINGINAMPAKGLCMDCTDDNLQALVDYMISQ